MLGFCLFLISANFFLIIGYSFSLGFYSFPSFWITLFSFFFLVTGFLYKIPSIFKTNMKQIEAVMVLMLMLLIAFTLYLPKELYELNTPLKPLQTFLFAVSFILAILLLLKISRKIKNKILLCLLAIPFISQILIIANTPSPKIDVYEIVQTASKEILRGKNPYEITYKKLYQDKEPNYYIYMPLSFLVTIPFRFLFGDVRFASVFSNLVICFIFLKLGKKIGGNNELGYLFPLIFLYQPLTTFVIGEGWLDTILIALLLLFGYFYQIKQKKVLSYIFLASTLGIKQNMFLLLPFILKLNNINIKQLLLAYIPIILLILLFLLRSPAEFISDTIKEPYFRETRYDALTIFSLIHSLIQFKLPKILYLFPVFLLPFFLLKKWGSLSIFYSSFAIWFLSSLLFFREAFLNQYYFVSSLLLISAFFFLLEENVKKARRLKN